jgi:hypothetical protein
MFKLITLALGLAIGFGGGVWWGQKNPQAAAQLSAEEERRFVQAQLAMNQKIKEKLDSLQNKTSSTPGSGFIGSSQAPAADVKDAKAEADKQEADLQAHLAKLK